MKKILSFVLAFMMIFSMLATSSSAATSLKICNVDIGIAPGSFMQFSNSDGSNSNSGYYYNGKYLGASQCFGFARWCQYKMFGCISLGNYDSEFKENSKMDFYWVSANGFSSVPAGQLTVSKIKALVNAAAPGAHIRTNKSSTGVAHSMIITNITATGFSIAQCNGSNNNEYGSWKQNYVGTYTYTWSSYVNSTYGLRGIDYIEMPYDYPYDNKPVISSAKGESHTEITIKWGKVDGATKYKVERRKSGDESYVTAKSSTTSTTFTDTGLEKGQRYYYKVTAYNGSTKLDTSESVGVYTKFSSPTVVAESNSKLKISWGSVAKAENYTIMRRESGAEEYEEIKTVAGTTYTDTGLSPATQYHYWIKANCVVDGEDIIAKSTTGSQYTLTKTPVISGADDISNSEITITWKAVSGASSYRVERRKSGSDNYSTVKSSTTATSFADTGLETGERYYYRVYAKNSAGESSASEAVGVYTKFAAPTVKTINSTQLQINWSSVSKAESYTVKRRCYNEDNYTEVKTVTGTSFTDSGLKNGTKYYYWIQANCNVDGTKIVAKSLTGEQFTQLANPTVTVVNDTSIKISWSTLNGHGTYKYIVQRKLSSETSYKNVTTITGTTFTDTGLKPATTYNYRIQVVNTSGTYCSVSNIVTTKTSACSHNYGFWTVSKAATCAEVGSEYRVCSKCSNRETRTIAATGKHSYGNWIVLKAATCSDPGSEHRVCATCSNKETKTIVATGKHIYKIISKVEATAFKEGYIEYKCDNCSSSYREVVKYEEPIETIKKVHSVSISDISMSYKDSATITPNISVDAGVDYTVTYSSSNTDVVSIDANGKLITNDKGSATITVTVTDEYGNTVTDTCKVNVSYKWWQWIIVIVLFGWIWY